MHFFMKTFLQEQELIFLKTEELVKNSLSLKNI